MRYYDTQLRVTLLIVLAAGAINALVLLGPGPIDPSNTTWIFGDNATYFSAWEQYRHDSHLHFPLTWTERIGYPVGTSIALLDPVPIAAVLLRPLSPLLPRPMQYLGPWAALCFILQAYFGFSLCRRFFPESPLFCALGSFFFLLSFPLTERALGHTSLLSQWLILAMLDGYFREPPANVLPWLARIWAILALAAATTPYIAAMCFVLAAAAVLRLRIENRSGSIASLGWLAVTLVVVAASGVAFGVLATSDAPTYFAAGLGTFSWNLNALVNPMSYGSMLLPPLRLAFEQQYEGYSYLGLGALALLGAGVVRQPQALASLRDRRLLPLIAAGVFCAAFALSPVVTFGARTLVTVSLPDAALRAFAALRATGRMVWPAYYLIVLGAIALTFRAWKPSYRAAILGVALVIQFADAMPLRAQVRKTLDQRFENPTRSAAWADLGRRFDNLILVPSFQCSVEDVPGGLNSFAYFGKLAASQQMRLNSYYGARYGRSELHVHCLDLLRAQLHGTLDAHSAYVVALGVRALWELNGIKDVSCRFVDGFHLCTPGANATADTWKLPAAATYVVDDEVDFRTGGNAPRYMALGWSPTTPQGTWTIGPVAFLRFGLDARDRATPLALEMRGTPFFAPSHTQLAVDVVVNGVRVTTWDFRMSSAPADSKALIPGEVVAARNELDVELHFNDPEAPLFAGIGPAPEFLGLATRAVVLRRVVK